MLKQGLGVVEGTPIIPYSSMTKQGRDEIWELLEEYVIEQPMEQPEPTEE
jgi:GTP-binding protein